MLRLRRSEAVVLYDVRCARPLQLLHLDAGRDNVKACARCRVVRYCSRSARKRRGQLIRSVATETCIRRWTQEWRDAIQPGRLALNLTNQRQLSLKHVFLFELERRRNARTPKKQFKMLDGEVMTREKALSILTEMGCPPRTIDNFRHDVRGNNTLQIVIIAEGLIKFVWFGGRDAITGEEVSLKDPTVDPSHGDLFAKYWKPAMINAIEEGTPP
ncbi:hypothetical protein LshimejAT787_0407140 [Lyophyllum shimeji]|uniref:Uncharacterized protein n=1 Tax=Lyophyllum shimeji TaxID=47721 RepID=A0A9P3PKN6_LYOSH|nr:hypothetical protein LshimejAT787_0407140 [Lyophyllum shimeji]